MAVRTCSPAHLLPCTPAPRPPFCATLPRCAVSPTCRSVEMDAGAGSNEDDITMKLMQIVEVNNILRQVRLGIFHQKLSMSRGQGTEGSEGGWQELEAVGIATAEQAASSGV